MDGGIGGFGEDDVFVNPRRFACLSHTTEEVLICLRLPLAEARAGSGARGASLDAVDAICQAEFFLKVIRLVVPRLVAIADHIVRTRDHAAGAPRAQPRVYDFLVKLFPLVSPAGGSGAHGRLLSAAAPSAGFEPARTAPEAAALSPELRGLSLIKLQPTPDAGRLGVFGDAGSHVFADFGDYSVVGGLGQKIDVSSEIVVYFVKVFEGYAV